MFNEERKRERKKERKKDRKKERKKERKEEKNHRLAIDWTKVNVPNTGEQSDNFAGEDIAFVYGMLFREYFKELFNFVQCFLSNRNTDSSSWTWLGLLK